MTINIFFSPRCAFLLLRYHKSEFCASHWDDSFGGLIQWASSLPRCGSCSYQKPSAMEGSLNKLHEQWNAPVVRQSEGKMLLKWHTAAAEAEDQAWERSQGNVFVVVHNKWVLAHFRNPQAIKLAQHFHMSDGSSSNPLFKITNTGTGMCFIIKLHTKPL